MLSFGISLILTALQFFLFGGDTIPIITGLGISVWMALTLHAQFVYNKGFL